MTERNTATLTCWVADDAALPEAYRASHDELLALLDGVPHGPVSWLTLRGIPALKFLQEAEELASPAVLATYDQIRGYLRGLGGIVVVAYAQAFRR